jgi:hypothetical protein
MPVGEVTLISVRLPSTSMPTNGNPRSRSAGPNVAQISRSPGLGSVACAAAAAHHVGAQIIRRRHAVGGAGEFAIFAFRASPCAGRCSVALDRAHPAVAKLLSSSKWRRETPPSGTDIILDCHVRATLV